MYALEQHKLGKKIMIAWKRPFHTVDRNYGRYSDIGIISDNSKVAALG
jgi:hypothetical protein